MKKSPWKTLDSKIVYDNPWLHVREDKVIRPDGNKGIYSVVETKSPVVYVIALTTKNEIYLVRLYRYPSKKWSWEIPGGGTDNQDIIIAGKRELKEETGLEAKKWHKIGSFVSMNGVTSERTYVVIAQDLNQTENNHQEEEGINEIKKIPLTQVAEMVKNGEIDDGQSLAALMQMTAYLGRIKI